MKICFHHSQGVALGEFKSISWDASIFHGRQTVNCWVAIHLELGDSTKLSTQYSVRQDVLDRTSCGEGGNYNWKDFNPFDFSHIFPSMTIEEILVITNLREYKQLKDIYESLLDVPLIQGNVSDHSKVVRGVS